MIVRAGRAIRTVILIGVRSLVTVILIAAIRGLLLAMIMVQSDHTAAEPGDHAEHQKP